MVIPRRDWQTPLDDPEPYDHCNALGPSAPKSKTRLNYTTLFLVAVLILWGVTAIIDVL